MYLITLIVFNVNHGILNVPLIATALNKVFKFADVEETGKVDVATIATLAVQLMGCNFSEAEKDLVNKKAEVKAENGKLQTQFSCGLLSNQQVSEKLRTSSCNFNVGHLGACKMLPVCLGKSKGSFKLIK